jgi:hypothetical protein
VASARRRRKQARRVDIVDPKRARRVLRAAQTMIRSEFPS